jgi:hypothetical protein
MFYRAGTEWRELQRACGETTVEVLSDFAQLHCVFPVCIRRANNPSAVPDFFIVSHSVKNALREYPKEYALFLDWKISDFIEEECSAFADLFEAALTIIVGVGEGPLYVAEEF